jgi:hypothetical protein
MGLRVYFSKTVALVGAEGQRYLEKCWRDLEEGCNRVDFKARTVNGTDHDTVSLAVEVWVEILASVQK